MERRKQQGQDVWKIVEQVNLNQLWHILKGGYQLCFFGLVALQDFRLSLLGCVVFWIVHDIFTNLGLCVKWNYLGTTAYLDRKFKKWWIQYIVKFSLLILFIYFNPIIKSIIWLLKELKNLLA